MILKYQIVIDFYQKEDIMIIEIIGSDCEKGTELYNKVIKIAEETSPYIQVLKANAEYSVNKYKVKEKPGLVINKKLIFEGKSLNEEEIKEIISKIKIK